MAVYVIGDVHGEADALRRLVDRVDPQPEDIVVQLGDCINRGPKSFEVVQYWLDFDRCPRYVLGGNHEELMYDYLAESADTLFEYGGQATVDSYQQHGWNCRRGDPTSIQPDHFQFYLQAFPWTRALLTTSQYIFVHAGYDCRTGPKEQNPATIRWGRVEGWKKGMPTVVRGHTPVRQVQSRPGSIHVDTGCGLGGVLSCLELHSGTVITERP